MNKALFLLLLLLLLLLVMPPARAATLPAPQLLDDGERAEAWQVIASDGIDARLSSEAGVLSLDYDFRGHAGYVVLRLPVNLELPPSWAFDLRLRGEGPRNTFEFKLLDPSLENVWWVNRRGFELPAEWLDLRTRGSRFEFAWGPAGGGTSLRRLAAIELAVTAGEGGRGRLQLDRLEFVTLPPPSAEKPVPSARATSAATGHGPELAIDGDAATTWQAGAAGPWRFEVDFGEARELGGVLLRWTADAAAKASRAYEVSGSFDGQNWRRLHRFGAAAGELDAFVAQELELRHLRLDFETPPPGLAELELLPAKLEADRNGLVARLAALSPRGDYPRAFLGETAFWTVAGEDGGRDEALLNEDGALEPWRGAFSLEPFVEQGGRVFSWADSRSRPYLPEGFLPMPAVEIVYENGPVLVVETASMVDGLLVRYRVHNPENVAAEAALLLALRPYQVDPPWQFLSQQGGVTDLRRLAVDEKGAHAEGREVLRLASKPSQLGAQPFEAGSLLSRLRVGKAPEARQLEDPQAMASAFFRFPLRLPPQGKAEVVVAFPWPGHALPATLPDFETVAAAGRAFWEKRLGAVFFDLPPAAGDLASVAKSALGHILIHRDGPAIQPGSRSYERSWIRDGALTSSALLRYGLGDAAEDFLQFFLPYQFENGKVPCCVDGRGSDPVPENDSGGQLLFLAHEIWRFGGDLELLRQSWPRLRRAVFYLDQLRQQRRGPEWQTEEKRVFYGLMPESISHEGYSAKPMHSYWDDFWAHRGFEDAAEMALALGEKEDAALFATWRDEFAVDLLASLERAMANHNIDHLPGCAELGDFDATSSAIALAPGRLGRRLPQEALRKTFERYYREVEGRFSGKKEWDAYTAYELRNAGALLRLGEREKAWQVLSWLLADRRPPGWNQMPEVTFREARAPRFNGDLPHGWVASELLRAVADLFVYENEDGDLEIAAGIPAAWLESGRVAVSGLHTPWGKLELELVQEGSEARLRIRGLRVPPGRAVFVHSPWGERRRLESLPADVFFQRKS